MRISKENTFEKSQSPNSIKKMPNEHRRSNSSSTLNLNKYDSHNEIIDRHIKKKHNKSIEHKVLENAVIQQAKYRDDVINSFRMPPLRSKHKITPSQYALMAQSRDIDPNVLRRYAKTPYNVSNFEKLNHLFRGHRRI